MQSNYKRLGDYIKPCNEKNEGNFIKKLQGISNKKYFQKAKTNTIGIDLSNYRVVRTGQFAFNRATTRNGDKISIALRKGKDCIVSPSYRIFKSKDESVLNSDYLMMWFRRPEFDRYARFKSHGSAHEFFDYDEMCDIMFPLPNIDEQLALVNEYHTITKRIQLNEQLNQKLEETAQTLYKHWFVDFEFPIDLCRTERSRSAFEEEISYNIDYSKGYKSSGGIMVYNEELDGEVPEGWEVEHLGKHLDINISNISKDDCFDFIKYYDTSSITKNVFTEPQLLNYKTDDIPSRAKRKVQHNDLLYSTVRPNLKHFGIIKNPDDKTLVSTGFVVLSNKSDYVNNEFFLLLLSTDDVINYFQSKAEMSVSTYPSIKPEDILEVLFPISKEQDIFKKFNLLLTYIFDSNDIRDRENLTLEKLKKLLLSKMATVEN